MLIFKRINSFKLFRESSKTCSRTVRGKNEGNYLVIKNSSWGTFIFSADSSQTGQCADRKKIRSLNFNTSEVIDINCMFYGCLSLKILKIYKFDTQNVINMENMFYQCQSLESIDLSSFNTKKVKDMNYMFFWCKKLNFIDLHTFNIENAIYMIKAQNSN